MNRQMKFFYCIEKTFFTFRNFFSVISDFDFIILIIIKTHTAKKAHNYLDYNDKLRLDDILHACPS